jgi:hypothetical protein
MESVQIQLADNVPFRFFKVRVPAMAAVRSFRDEGGYCAWRAFAGRAGRAGRAGPAGAARA